MQNRSLPPLLLLLLGLELALAFGQYCQLPLDGDLAAIAVPAAWYQPVLHDPFGWAVLTRGAHYAATNRFFAHVALLGYLRAAPRGLQVLAAPIDSIYLAAALFDTAVQAALLALLAAYIRLSSGSAWGRGWSLLAAVLLAPLFQLSGYQAQMGIISRSLTYNFFYALPLALLLLWLLPFYQAWCRQQPLRLPWPQVLGWAGLAVVLAFNGPIVVAALGVVGLLGVGASVAGWPAARSPHWWSGQALGLLTWFGGLSIWSLWVGRNNAENSHSFTLPGLYRLLPHGIFEELTSKLGLPLLLLFLLLNVQLVRRFGDVAESQRVRQVVRWVGAFAVVFVLLLPLGGYRPYRPFLLRNDSIMPILLGLLLAYGLTTTYLLRHLPARPRRWYIGGVVLFSGIFFNANHLWLHENNTCEREALARLARAQTEVVRLPPDCTIMAWEPCSNPQQSVVNAELLAYWGVTPRRILYYQ